MAVVSRIRELRAQGRLDAAYAELSRLAPAPGALAIEAYNLGIELKRARRVDAAAASFAFALRCSPRLTEAHLEIGALLLVGQRFLAAIPHFEAVVRANPAASNAWLGLGQCLLRTGQGRRALEALQQVRGDFAATPLMMAWQGSALRLAGDDDGALARYAAALAREPGCYDALFGRALIRDQRGDLAGAADDFRRAHAAQPGDNWSLGNLVYALQRMCAWAELAAPQAELVARLERGEINGYASQWFALDVPATTLRRIAQEFVRAQSALRVQSATDAFAPGDAGTRHRIAYVSADFRDHATARLLVEVLERHDRSRFEILGYALQPSDASALGRRIVAACDRFMDVSGLPVDQVASRLRADGIDVMVDLMGHTRGSLPGLSALRPAPVIVNYLGFPGTVGDYADYIVGDRYVTPPGSEAEFSEAIARLPGCYQPNDRQREVGRATTRAEHGLPEGAIVACSFNQAWKLGPALWSLWMQAMRTCGRMVLWLLEDNSWASTNLRNAASQAGIDPARIIFAPRVPQPEHMARLGLADIALDTAPCNSHTTASDALWMGVPILTREGRRYDGRVAASLLHAVDLPALIARDERDYAQKLATLLDDDQHLAELKRSLIAGRSRARLWDAAATARALERAYDAMLARARAGLPPAPIDLGNSEAPHVAEPESNDAHREQGRP